MIIKNSTVKEDSLTLKFLLGVRVIKHHFMCRWHGRIGKSTLVSDHTSCKCNSMLAVVAGRDPGKVEGCDFET